MKKYILLALLASISSANAHSLSPDSYTTTKGVDETMIIVHLKDNQDGEFAITVNGLSTGANQFVFANETADFPILVKNDQLVNDSAKICAMRDDDSSFKKEVCVIVKAI